MIASLVEYLISNGHIFSEIAKYSLPQLLLFNDLIVERVTGSQGTGDTSGDSTRKHKHSFYGG